MACVAQLAHAIIFPCMHAIFVVPRFRPYRGGYENYVFWLARHLCQRGDRATVLTTTAFDLESFWLAGFRNLPAGRETLDGINVVRLPISYARWARRTGRLLGLVPKWQLQAQFASPSFAVPDLAAQLRDLGSVDVIHVGPLPYNRLMYEGLREGRRQGARVIATPCTHFGEDSNSTVMRHYTRPFQIQLLKCCDCVLALTNVERERLIAAGLAADRVHATGAGIDSHDVSNGNGAAFRSRYGIEGPIVVQIGTKAWDKGSMMLVEAMQRLWADRVDAWLVLAGSSTRDFEEYLRARGGRFPRLLNLPSITEEEKRDLLSAATFLVHPSRVESLGLVYLEAWANSIPVIAADTAVSREVIENERDGLLVPFGNEVALAGAVRRLLENPALCRSLGMVGQKKVLQRFSWRAAADRIYPFFRSENREAPQTVL